MTDKERLEEIEKNLDPLGYGMGGHLISVNDIYWLVGYAKEQAERVQELEEDLTKYRNGFEFQLLINNSIKKQNKRYREALEFYADKETYEPLEVKIGAVTKEGYKISKNKYNPIINTDKGKKARKALGSEENEPYLPKKAEVSE